MKNKQVAHAAPLTLFDKDVRVTMRTERGFTQSDVAAALDVSRQTFNGWESGKVKPTGKNFRNYAEMLAAWQTSEGRANDAE